MSQKQNNIAILVFGDTNSGRNALTEDKYKDLATAFIAAGFNVSSVLYNDKMIGKYLSEVND